MLELVLERENVSEFGEFCSKVRKVDGMKLASEYETLFDEVSAADGRNVEVNLLQLAKLLAEKQDLDIQKSMTLNAKKLRKEKKNCC